MCHSVVLRLDLDRFPRIALMHRIATDFTHYSSAFVQSGSHGVTESADWYAVVVVTRIVMFVFDSLLLPLFRRFYRWASEDPTMPALRVGDTLRFPSRIAPRAPAAPGTPAPPPCQPYVRPVKPTPTAIAIRALWSEGQTWRRPAASA
jgi:hypothetical protein